MPSVVIATIISLGLTGCDDEKAETETLPFTNGQPVTPAPEAKPTEAPVAKAEAKPEAPARPVVDGQAVFDERMDAYIECYNKLQISVQRNLARYAGRLKDSKQGPIDEERTVYDIYGVSESDLAEYEKGVKSAVALTPALQPIDGVTVGCIDAAVMLGGIINEMGKYRTQEDYKDDAFVKGKTLHQTSLKNLEASEPIAEPYHVAIQEVNDRYQLAELKSIEEREGKVFHYYFLAVMILAKQISNLISQDKFDAETAMKKVSELETLAVQTREADKGGISSSFINSIGRYQLETKKYAHRIRDKVSYPDWDEEQLQDANSSWTVEGSLPRALREYNEMVDDYNGLR